MKLSPSLVEIELKFGVVFDFLGPQWAIFGFNMGPLM